MAAGEEQIASFELWVCEILIRYYHQPCFSLLQLEKAYI